jgi:hypothetical protein
LAFTAASTGPITLSAPLTLELIRLASALFRTLSVSKSLTLSLSETLSKAPSPPVLLLHALKQCGESHLQLGQIQCSVTVLIERLQHHLSEHLRIHLAALTATLLLAAAHLPFTRTILQPFLLLLSTP